MKAVVSKAVLAASLALALPSSPAAAASDPHARDLIVLTDWFEGEWDNEEQLWFQNYPGMLEEGLKPHERMHTMHRRIDAPALGEHVFYVEDYLDNDPAKVFRQRIAIFLSEPEAGGIRMRNAFLRDEKAALGGYFDPQKLANLTPEDIFFIETVVPGSNCDILWTREADHFNGAMFEKQCVFGEGEDRRYSIHDMVLSQDKFWRADLTRRLSDNSIKAGHSEDRPHKLRRALPFTCTGRFFSDPTATNDAATASVQRFEGKRIHSQGGTFRVTRESDKKEFEVQMRTKQYPFYTERPDFIYFLVREDGSDRSMVFTVNDTLSRHLGATIPGLSVYCSRIGYEFDETFEQLEKAAS